MVHIANCKYRVESEPLGLNDFRKWNEQGRIRCALLSKEGQRPIVHTVAVENRSANSLFYSFCHLILPFSELSRETPVI